MARRREVPLVNEIENEDFNERYQLCNLKNMYDHLFKTLWKIIIELDKNKNINDKEQKIEKGKTKQIKLKKEKIHNHAMVFSGFRQGDGASTMSLNFANAFAENSSNSVVLVDGNLRNPVLHYQFKIKKKKGLFDALQGNASIQDISTEIIPKKLFFIPAGQQTKNPITLFESSKYVNLIKQLREVYDLVIFDSAPLLGNPETILLANKMDGLIMVLNADVTRWEVAKSVKSDLEDSNVRILGAILNRKQFIIPQAVYKFI